MSTRKLNFCIHEKHEEILATVESINPEFNLSAYLRSCIEILPKLLEDDNRVTN
jgi:hypothetical protein